MCTLIVMKILLSITTKTITKLNVFSVMRLSFPFAMWVKNNRLHLLKFLYLQTKILKYNTVT